MSAPSGNSRSTLSLTDVIPERASVSTRGRLSKTKLGEAHGVRRVDVEAAAVRPTIVTRRNEMRRRKRRKHILIGVALALALFPPMWAIYLIAWLVWRSRPKQRSMREVRRSIRSLEKGRHGIALKRLQDAHLLDPQNTDALYWLGLLLSRENREEEAEEALSIVAERVPGVPEVESALVDAYVALRQPENAIYHAQRLFDVAPYDPETHVKLAAALEAAGKLDLAIAALKQSPEHHLLASTAMLEVHYQLGRLFELKGDPAQAAHHFGLVYARDITYRDVRLRVDARSESGA